MVWVLDALWLCPDLFLHALEQNKETIWDYWLLLESEVVINCLQKWLYLYVFHLSLQGNPLQNCPKSNPLLALPALSEAALVLFKFNMMPQLQGKALKVKALLCPKSPSLKAICNGCGIWLFAKIAGSSSQGLIWEGSQSDKWASVGIQPSNKHDMSITILSICIALLSFQRPLHALSWHPYSIIHVTEYCPCMKIQGLEIEGALFWGEILSTDFLIQGTASYLLCSGSLNMGQVFLIMEYLFIY